LKDQQKQVRAEMRHMARKRNRSFCSHETFGHGCSSPSTDRAGCAVWGEWARSHACSRRSQRSHAGFACSWQRPCRSAASQQLSRYRMRNIFRRTSSAQPGSLSPLSKTLQTLVPCFVCAVCLVGGSFACAVASCSPCRLTSGLVRDMAATGKDIGDASNRKHTERMSTVASTSGTIRHTPWPASALTCQRDACHAPATCCAHLCLREKSRRVSGLRLETPCVGKVQHCAGMLTPAGQTPPSLARKKR
jgi:hypothetical protein